MISDPRSQDFGRYGYSVRPGDGGTFIVIEGYGLNLVNGVHPESIVPRAMGFTNAADLVEWQRQHHLAGATGGAMP
jgi:hypothetical protein